LVYVYYNLRLWVKQLEATLDWLEDSGDDHGISEDLDQDVPEDIQFHVESASVPPTEP
jgi:hypothetical protein